MATAFRLDECKAACYRVRRLLLARNVNADDVIGSVMAYQILVNCLMFSTLYLLAISFYTINLHSSSVKIVAPRSEPSYH